MQTDAGRDREREIEGNEGAKAQREPETAALTYITWHVAVVLEVFVVTCVACSTP